MSETALRIRVLSAIAEVSAPAWNACAAGPLRRDLESVCERAPAASDRVSAEPSNPFVTHEFLHALEASGSAVARTGWQPRHLVIEDDDAGVVGAAPCYLKSHSRGEYVFDWGWAEAYERAGGAYYPKLQVSVPFTPAVGPRLMVRAGADAQVVRGGLAAGLVELCRMRRASSAHVTFLPESEWELLGSRGFLQRTHQQFHWENAGYANFDDFLDALAARKRKAVRRERRDALANGISVQWLTGAALTVDGFKHQQRVIAAPFRIERQDFRLCLRHVLGGVTHGLHGPVRYLHSVW